MWPIGDFQEIFAKISLGKFLSTNPPAYLLLDATRGVFRPETGEPGDTLTDPDVGFDQGTSTRVTREVAFMVFPIASPSQPDAVRFLLGRARNCDIRITDRSVSRGHALIERKGESYFLQDIGSRTGTKVNGQLLEAGTSHPLSPGEQISLGTVDLTFLDPTGFYHFVSKFLGE